MPTNLLTIKMQNIYKRVLKRKGGFTFYNLYQELETIGINTNDDTFKQKYEDIYQDIDITSFEDFLNNFQIKSFLNNYIINPILNHSYYSYLKTNIYISNNIINYFSDDYFGYENNINTPNIKLDESNENKVLYKFGNIKNNTIYLYNFQNIHTYFTKNILDLSEKTNNDKYFNGFIKKYFPKITKTNVRDYITTELLTQEKIMYTLDLQETIIKNSTNIHKLIENSDNLLKEDISIASSNVLSLRFEHDLNIFDSQSNLDLLSIFNELLLNYDIPFVKLKDPTTREMIYKIFKPITEVEYQNYDPIVKNTVLQEWINFIGAEYNDGIYSKIKGNIKNIQYKLRLFDVKISNKIIEGTIYKINESTNSFDVLINENNKIKANITYNFLKEWKKAGTETGTESGTESESETDSWINIDDESLLENIKSGDNIKFIDFDTYYGNVEITKSGKVIFDTTYKLDQNINFEYIVEQLISKCNFFIEILKNLDFLKSKSDIILPIDINLLHFNSTFYNTNFDNLGLCTKIQIPKNIVLDYDTIKKISACCWPYITILDNVYFKGEEIEYYNEDISKWTEGNIIKINTTIPTTYSLTVTSIDKTTTKVITDISSRVLRKKGQKQYRKFIDFKYKRISYFNNLPPIKLLIYKKFNQSMSNSDIIKSVVDIFSITIDNATKIVHDTLDNVSGKLQTNIGINIKINYLDYEKMGTYNIYKIYIEGLSDIVQIKKINKFLISFFKLYAENHKKNLNILNENYLEIKEKYLQIDSETGFNDTDIHKTNNVSDSDDDIAPDVNAWMTSSDEDEDSDSDEWNDQDSPNANDEDGNKGPDGNEGPDETKTLDIDLVQSKRRQNVSYILQQLYDHDNELFTWKSTPKHKSYTKGCQEAKRHPKVITDKQKKYIDANSPQSYGNPGDIDCDFTIDNPNPGPKPKCKAIRWGSSKQKSNWYICPKIWDIKDNIPLKITDLKFNNGKQFIPDKVNWRKHYEPDNDEWHGKDILEFDPKYEGRGLINKSGENKFMYPNNKQSLWLQPLFESDRYDYPGFLKKGKHPEGIPVPCCFKGYSKNAKEHFDDGITASMFGNEYIQGYNKSLGPQRIGLLHPKLYEYLGITLENCKTGELDYRSNCFLRRGIKQSYNTFLSLIANFNNDMSEERLIDLILENITYDEFLTLNNGNLEIQFRNTTKHLFSSFQNYLEYIISDKTKKYIYFWDYLTRPHKWLFPNGISLILIDTIIDNGEVDFEIICPYFFNTDKITNSNNNNIALAIKNDDIYEPIYFYYNKIEISKKDFQYPLRIIASNPLKYKDIFKQKTTHKQKITYYLKKLTSLHDTFIKNLCIENNNKSKNKMYDKQIKNHNKLSDALLTPENDFMFTITEISKNIKSKNLNSNFQPLKIIYDNYNKAIGILLINSVYIPIKPECLVGDIRSKLVNIMDSRLDPYNINSTFLISGDKMIEQINKLSDKIPELKIKIIRKIVSNVDNNMVIGLETETAAKIHIKQTPIDSPIFNGISDSSNYIDADKKILNYSEFYNKKFFKPLYTLKKTIMHLNKINDIYSTDYYNIAKLFIPNPDNIVKGVITINNLLIKIQDINIDDIDIEYKSLPHIIEFKIDDYESSINNYFELWKYSNTDLHVKPIRNIMNLDKNITGYVLENGTEIMLNDDIVFNIKAKIDNQYSINQIPNIEFDSIINEIKPQLYESKFIDKRVKYIKKLKYKKNVYENLKNTVASFLQMPENFKIKDYLINQLNYLGKTISKKRREMKPIFERLFNLIAVNSEIDNEYFNKIIRQSNYKLCINNTENCEKSIYCSNVPFDKQTHDNVTIFYKTIRLTEDNQLLLNNNELLKAHLIKIQDNLDTDISDSHDINKRIFLTYLYSISEEQVRERVEKIVEILNIIETNIENDKYKFCKIKIHTIIKTGVAKTQNKNLFYIFLNQFIEEMIRNKFKRIQIMKNIKMPLNDDKYIVNKPLEILFSENDFNISNINDLYRNILRQYYTNIDIYDYKNPDISNIKMILNLKPDSIKLVECIADKKINNIPYIIIKSKDKLVKNKNTSTINKKINLSKHEYNRIKNYLDLLNTNLDECKIKQKFTSLYTIVDKKQRF